MFRKTVSAVMLFLVLVSTLTLPFNVHPAESEPKTWTVDDDGPADFSTIQEAINAANAGDTIFVKAGTYYEDVEVNETVSLVGENRVSTIVEGGISVGIGYIFNPFREIRVQNVRVSDFTIQNGHGTFIENSDNCTIDGNIVKNCTCGLQLHESTNCVLRDNNLTGNQVNFGVYSQRLEVQDTINIKSVLKAEDYVHDVDVSNTINGKPVYYWVNQHNKEVPYDAGYVAAVNSTNITIRNLNLTNVGPVAIVASTNITIQDLNQTGIGALFAWAFNSTIKNVEFVDSTGIGLVHCQGCQVSSNKMRSGKGYPIGISVINSDRCTVDGNAIVRQNQAGILLRNSTQCIVVGNNVQNTSGRQFGGICVAGSDSCTVNGNLVCNNDADGIYLVQSDHCAINGNTVENNTYCGIYIDYSNNGAVIGNNVSANLQGIYSMNVCTHWEVAGNKAENNRAGGITLNGLYNSTIAANTATDNSWGIMLHYSADCALTENNVSRNEDEGIYLALGHGFLYNPPTQSLIAYFGNCTVYANEATNNTHGIKIVDSANCTLRNNTMSDNTYNFDVSGSLLQDFISDIDVSNLVDGKPVYFLVNQHDRTIPADAGYVGIINSTNTSAQNLTLTNNGQGVLLAYASNCTISRNSMSNNLNGISLYNSTQNLIYHNNFINNDCHATAFTVFVHNGNFTFPNLPTVVTIKGGEHLNIWDDGYPSGGNYWDYHNPPDLYSGPGQNVTGSDMIGDEAYNTDRYPLIYPYDYVPSPDLNNDGIINIVDVAIVAKAFGSKPGHEYWNPIADIDINETINIVDVATVAKEFGKEWKGGT